MSTPAAFRAVYSDWKLIRTRGVVQIVFETPIENSHVAYRVLGGMPDPGGSAWFDISPFDKTAREEPHEVNQVTDPPQSAPCLQPPQAEGGARKSWAQKSYAEQAGIRCNEPKFHAFLRETRGRDIQTPGEAADYVRLFCGVTSRANIALSPAAASCWRALDREYLTWDAMERCA